MRYVPANPSESGSVLQLQANRFRQRLLAREAEIAGQMAEAFEIAARSMKDALDDLGRMILDRQLDGLPVPVSWLHRQRRYRALIDQSISAYSKYGRAVGYSRESWMDRAVDEAMDDAGAMLDAALPGYGELIGAFNRLPENALIQLKANLAPETPVGQLIDSYGRRAAEVVETSLFDGIAQGLHPDQVVRRIQDRLREDMIPRGATVVRTEMYRAYREANRATYVENDHIVNAWVWNAYLGPFTCAACWAMHGQEFPTDTPMGSHPNCRCTLIPKTKTWADLGFPGMEALDVPPVESGSDVFDRLPPDQQRKILGPVKYSLYKDGKIKLGDVVHKTVHPKYGVNRTVASRRNALANAATRQAEETRLAREATESLEAPKWLRDARARIDQGIHTEEDARELGGILRKSIKDDLPKDYEKNLKTWRATDKKLTKEEDELRSLRGHLSDDEIRRRERSIRQLRYDRDNAREALRTGATPRQLARVKDLDKEYDGLMKKIDDIPDPTSWDPDSPSYQEFVARKEALRDRVISNREKRKHLIGDTNLDLSRSVQDRLRALRPMGRGNIQHSVLPTHPRRLTGDATDRLADANDYDVQRLFDDALDQYPTAWADASSKAGDVIFGRALRGSHWNLGTHTEITTSGNRLFDQYQTMVHEVAHRMEKSVPAIRQMEQQFYDRRTKGLRSDTLPGYAANERGRPDKFFDPYIGKDYGGRSFEILSMGAEAILSPQAASLGGRHIMEDLEMLDFILGVLGGV